MQWSPLLSFWIVFIKFQLFSVFLYNIWTAHCFYQQQTSSPSYRTVLYFVMYFSEEDKQQYKGYHFKDTIIETFRIYFNFCFVVIADAILCVIRFAWWQWLLYCMGSNSVWSFVLIISEINLQCLFHLIFRGHRIAWNNVQWYNLLINNSSLVFCQ